MPEKLQKTLGGAGGLTGLGGLIAWWMENNAAQAQALACQESYNALLLKFMESLAGQ